MNFTASNNGHALKVAFPAKEYNVSGGGLNDIYTTFQLHLHWGSDNSKGSEHTMNGKSYAAEVSGSCSTFHFPLHELVYLSVFFCFVFYFLFCFFACFSRSLFHITHCFRRAKLTPVWLVVQFNIFSPLSRTVCPFFHACPSVKAKLLKTRTVAIRFDYRSSQTYHSSSQSILKDR